MLVYIRSFYITVNVLLLIIDYNRFNNTRDTKHMITPLLILIS